MGEVRHSLAIDLIIIDTALILSHSGVSLHTY